MKQRMKLRNTAPLRHHFMIERFRVGRRCARKRRCAHFVLMQQINTTPSLCTPAGHPRFN